MIYRSVKPNHFKPEIISDPLMTKLINKIELVQWHNPDLKETKINVILKDSKEFNLTCKNRDIGSLQLNEIKHNKH